MTRFEPQTTPWNFDDSEFYELDSFARQMEHLLQYAILAPSTHNVQPWKFRIASNGIEVYADFTRRLQAIDPADRELLMSIGAAITNFRVASAHFFFDTSVTYIETTADPELVAFIAVRETGATDLQLRRLFSAIKSRHTNRNLFEEEKVDPDSLAGVCDVVDQFHQTLRFVFPQHKSQVAELTGFADKQQMPPLFGALQAKRDGDLIKSATGLIAVLADDDRQSLVAAGEILERLLLTITRDGLHYSFFNSSIQVSELRSRIATLVGGDRPAQLLLRVGRARTGARPMPRRPFADVVQ